MAPDACAAGIEPRLAIAVDYRENPLLTDTPGSITAKIRAWRPGSSER